MMHCPVSQVLRLELKKFAVDVVTVQPGDFSKVPASWNIQYSERVQRMTTREEHDSHYTYIIVQYRVQFS
jgi:hypothetical protein